VVTPGIEPETSGSVARNSDHKTTVAVNTCTLAGSYEFKNSDVNSVVVSKNIVAYGGFKKKH
jgi:hypothetical protein